MSDFLHPDKDIHQHGEKLPHWQQGEVMQFVTFRLADSLPQNKLRDWRDQRDTWLSLNPQPWSPSQEKEYHQRFTKALEDWLDQGSGSCLLRLPSNRLPLKQTLMHDQDTRAIHQAWVIMQNHVHLLFTPNFPLPDLMKSWKGVSARKIGLGSIWQKNYRDTLIRDIDHFINAVRYIRRNPAKLPPDTFTLWQSERAIKIP